MLRLGRSLGCRLTSLEASNGPRLLVSPNLPVSLNAQTPSAATQSMLPSIAEKAHVSKTEDEILRLTHEERVELFKTALTSIMDISYAKVGLDAGLGSVLRV